MGKIKHIFFIAVGLCMVCAATAQEKRNLLTDFYTRKIVSETVTKDNKWISYPSYKDRDSWAKVPEGLRNQTIEAGEEFLGYPWPTITATMYLEFTRTGNRAIVDGAISNRMRALRSLVFAELMEGEGRFLDDIINGVFTFCEQTYWGMSATFYMYKTGSQGHNKPNTKLPDIDDPIVDLFVGDAAADLAWTWHFFHEEFDKISPVISKRLKSELQKKVLNPFYERYDFWWITGWGEGRVNNWTPWCNYNMLTTILLIEDDPVKKEVGIYKTMESVDLFINSYPEDGGCDEGPSYWGLAGGKLFDYLDLLRRNTKGEIDIFDDQLIKNMGRYIYRVYISGGDYYINFADAPLRIRHDPGKIFRYGKNIEDPVMKSFGAYLLKESDFEQSPISGRIGENLENLFNLGNWENTPPTEPLISDYYLPDLDIAFARDEEGTTNGFYFSAKGGSNGEGHNHNDVGSFMLYFNGNPVLIDVGVGTYTSKTFSPQRYDIWTMQSAYHNLPIINGTSQHQGGNFRATNSKFAHSKKKVSYATDISGAYTEDAKVNSWIRSYTLERGNRFIVKDDIRLSENTGKTKIIFMSGIPCRVLKDGVVEFQGKDFKLHMKYNPTKLTAAIELIEIDDPKLIRSLGDEISRVVFSLEGNTLAENILFEMVEEN